MRILFLIILINFLYVQIASANSININFFTRFNDECLQKYIQQALDNNHELKQANFRVEQYRAEVKNAFSKELPELSVSSNYLGAHFPRGDGNFLLKQNSYILPFRASWEPDLLLKNKDKIRSSKKLLKAQIENQRGVYISLLTDVASAYTNILLYDYLIQKQAQIVADKARYLKYKKAKYDYGTIDITDLNDASIDYELQLILYNNLVKQQKTTLYNFALLIGESAYNAEDFKRGKLEDFEYQQVFPKTIKSDLIYFRPDVIEAEQLLKSAKIDVTIAKKDFFPSFNITGFLIFDTAGKGNFFSWQSSFAYLLAGLTQDIFKGGAKIANLKLKKARYYELVENYKQKDLNAIKEINNTLNLIQQDTISENNTKKQLEFERKNFKSASRKYEQGVISAMDFLDTRNTLHQKEQLLAANKAARIVDYFTMYKVVGGVL